MKKLLFVFLVIFFVFVIYVANRDKKIYYLALGNSERYLGKEKNYSFYIENYLKEEGIIEKAVYDYTGDDRITSLIGKINRNERGKSSTLKNALVKADIISIKIEVPDLIAKLNDEYVIINDVYDYVDDLSVDLEKLFSVIRNYCKEDIVFIGYPNCYHKEIFDYLNKRFKRVCDKYNIIFVDIDDINYSDECSSSVSNKMLGDLVLRELNFSVFKG